MIKGKYHFFAFLIIFFSTLLVFNVKTYLLLFIFAFIMFFFFLKDNLLESTFLTFLVSLPFENSIRQWLIYSNQNNPTGYVLYFGVTPKIIFGLLLLLLLLLPKNKYISKNKTFLRNSYLLLIFFILTTITSLFFQFRISTVFLGYVSLTLAIFYYYSAAIYFSFSNNKHIFFEFITALIIFSSTLGLMQMIKQSPTGIYIELTPSFAQTTGYTTTDGKQQYRVAGFISHPVYFGSFLSIIIPIIIGLYFNKKQLFYIPLIIASIVVLLGTLSRSTWINLTIIFICFYYYQKKHPFNLPKLKISKKITHILIPMISILILFLITPFIFNRLKSIPDLFNNKEGSGFTRVRLALDSLKITANYPFTGIGLNSFAFENHSAPPHNTFLIFLVELGIPTTLVFITFIIKSIIPKFSPERFRPTVFGTWVGLLTFVIVSSQVHPLFNIDPTFNLFMLILGYFTTCQPSTT